MFETKFQTNSIIDKSFIPLNLFSILFIAHLYTKHLS